jgi:orotidine-5'-phosphate decarboxylase
MTAFEKLTYAIKKNNSLVCIGLDPEISKIPKQLTTSETPQFDFNRAIIDATHNLVCAYKPNPAFYEARGAAGIRELKLTCDYIREMYPDIFLILDLKRADIGNTSAGSAAFGFDYLGADAVTLNPYLGYDGLTPYLERPNKASFILCRTSNAGSGEIQDLPVDGMPLYQKIALKVATDWNKHKNCGLVVGATYPEELARVRELAPSLPILTPGIGGQGGSLEATLRAGLTPVHTGLLINSSRGIIFTGNEEDFVQQARRAAIDLRDRINNFL